MGREILGTQKVSPIAHIVFYERGGGGNEKTCHETRSAQNTVACFVELKWHCVPIYNTFLFSAVILGTISINVE